MKTNMKSSWKTRLLILAIFGFCATSWSQEETISSRMSVNISQLQSDSILVEGLCRARIDRRYVGLSDLTLFFVNQNDTADQDLGTFTTGIDGKISAQFVKNQLLFNPDSSFTIICRFDGNDQYEGSEDEVTLYEAQIEVDPNTEDSIKSLDIQISNYKDEPVMDEDIVIYVKRLFSLLPIGEGTTDEDGFCNVKIPADLPGDDSGNLHYVIKLDDHSDYGTLINEFTLDWGIPVSSKNGDAKRNLWTPYPPWWMFVIFLGLLAAIWAHYVHIVIKLFKIKSLGS